MIIVYTTCKDRKEAKSISKVLIEKKLAACTNNWEINSCYSWKGIKESSEIAMIIKTKEQLVPEVFEAVKSLSSYDTPALFVIPVSFVEDNYLEWLNSSTQ